MFGILKPLQGELRVKDLALYRSVYCGVCRAIGMDCGRLCRLTLQYDAALAALIWMGLSGEKPRMENRICFPRPVKPHPVAVGVPALRHAGALNVVLAREHCLDDARDEKKALGAAGAFALRGPGKRSATVLGGAAGEVASALQDLYVLEKAGCAVPDQVADASGRMLRAALDSYPHVPQDQREALRWMGYHMGRWIYLMDSLQDEAKDAASGAYNPLQMMPGPKEAARAALAESADYSASQAAAAFDVMRFSVGREIIENVIYAGMPAVRDKILIGENG